MWQVGILGVVGLVVLCDMVGFFEVDYVNVCIMVGNFKEIFYLKW